MTRAALLLSCGVVLALACAGPVAAVLDDADRNLALNLNDTREAGHGVPHASSNSETRGEQAFWAINAIDGRKDNRGHGADHPSWGPEKRTDAWWKVEFGQTVEVDKVVIWIRADFPHDGAWRAATLVFSDGSRETIALRKTAEPQTFGFARRRTRALMITDLVQDEPLQWCGLTEVEVWGRAAK
jgi:hypothetical protein